MGGQDPGLGSEERKTESGRTARVSDRSASEGSALLTQKPVVKVRVKGEAEASGWRARGV